MARANNLDSALCLTTNYETLAPSRSVLAQLLTPGKRAEYATNHRWHIWHPCPAFPSAYVSSGWERDMGLPSQMQVNL
jgi:hypothetical protein